MCCAAAGFFGTVQQESNCFTHQGPAMTTPSMTKEWIIDKHVLTFDPGDPRNGSLYIGEPLLSDSGIFLAHVLDDLRAATLWSSQPEKQVPDAHRAAYREQLELIEAIGYRTDGGEFLIARFDHPKFPSDAGRWQSWCAFFDERYTRAG
jgi:hypothetical protein